MQQCDRLKNRFDELKATFEDNLNLRHRIVCTCASVYAQKALATQRPTPNVLVRLPARVLAWLLLIPICLSLPNRVSFARVCGCVCCFVFRICLHAFVRDFDLTLSPVCFVCACVCVCVCVCVCCFVFRICLHTFVRDFHLTLSPVCFVCVCVCVIYRNASTLPLVFPYHSRIRCFVCTQEERVELDRELCTIYYR